MRTLLALSVPLALVACGGGSEKVPADTSAFPDTADTAEPSLLALEPSSLDFGTVLPGEMGTAAFVARNLDVQGVTLSLSSTATNFSVTTSSLTLGAGDEAAVTVTFQDVAGGTYTGEILILGFDGEERGRVSLQAIVDGNVDTDGDGVLSATDCDDTNADVYPGAQDAWYDGVDSDCAGNDDYDQDADGHAPRAFGGADCNDNDAAVNPDALEIWYDGVDQDCAGDDDYDQDGDSQQSDSFGGTDCDDADAAVYAGAPEVWYDGVDQDCAGGGDFDQDGDGHDADSFGGDDCDDTDPTAYAGAVDAAYDGVDSDCAGNDDYDVDGDGVRAIVGGGDDCDDTRASTFPGAADGWYDGVDSDCAGNDDYDQDFDGDRAEGFSGGGDCDDLDATRSSLVTETWYDGVDSDCAGDDDYDQDGDRQQATAYGGADCDDSVATTYAGAPDTPYDGVDADCAGDDDYDTDGDGDRASGYGGGDCDDTDAARASTLPEDCDGIDNDCDGVRDDGLSTGTTAYYADSDGDGYGGGTALYLCAAAPGLTTSANDCDDTVASVNPGASEVAYDSVDQDCDGYVDDMAAETVSSWTVTGNRTGDGFGAGALALAGNVLGSGDSTLIACAPDLDVAVSGTTYTDTGACGFLDSRTAADPAAWNAGSFEYYGGTAGTYYSGYGYYGMSFASNEGLGTGVASLGDMDGDGYEDLVVAGSGFDGTSTSDRGGLFFVSAEAYVASGSTYAVGRSDPYGLIYGANGSDILGYALASGDMDGDGNLDLAAGAPGHNSSAGRTYVFTFDDYTYSSRGSLYFTSDNAGVASYAVSGVSSGDHLGYSVLLADLDDDGYDDLVTCSPDDDDNGSGSGSCWYDRGRASLSTSSTVSSAADASFAGSIAGDQLGLTRHALAAGDFDGDSLPDLAIGVPGYDGGSTNGGAVAIWRNGTISGSETLSSAEWLATGDGSLGTAVLLPGDVDGDGTGDLLAGAPTAGGAGRVYLLSGGAARGTWALPASQAASWVGNASGDAFGSSLAGLRDLDGNGRVDFAAGAPGADPASVSNAGKIYVLPVYP